jgi:hypothetical protein
VMPSSAVTTNNANVFKSVKEDQVIYEESLTEA